MSLHSGVLGVSAQACGFWGSEDGGRFRAEFLVAAALAAWIEFPGPA